MQNENIKERLLTCMSDIRSAQSALNKASDCLESDGLDDYKGALMKLGAIKERLEDIEEIQFKLERYMHLFISDVKEEIEKGEKQ